MAIEGAVVDADNVGGKVSRVRIMTPEGLVEGGRHLVRAGGGRTFVASEWTKYGIDDAMKVRAKRLGEPEPLPYHQILKEALDSGRARVDKERREKLGLAPVAAQAAPAPAAAPQSDLGKLLSQFEGDEEMQILILKKWNAKHAPAVAPVVPLPNAEPAIDDAVAADIEKETEARVPKAGKKTAAA